MVSKFLSSLLLLCGSAFADVCTYRTWDWDKINKKSVNHRTVRKDRRDIDDKERGVVKGCSVCEEDQVDVRIPGVVTFKICKAFVREITYAIQEGRDAGFPINSVIGYRVGKSKGPLDEKGRRTEFSNHSYGTAIDINSETNGLYDGCAVFSPNCRLIRGGPYLPGAKSAITPATAIYQAFRKAGFRWGGEIKASQKDFMHFSLDGM